MIKSNAIRRFISRTTFIHERAPKILEAAKLHVQGDRSWGAPLLELQ